MRKYTITRAWAVQEHPPGPQPELAVRGFPCQMLSSSPAVREVSAALGLLISAAV